MLESMLIAKNPKIYETATRGAEFNGGRFVVMPPVCGQYFAHVVETT